MKQTLNKLSVKTTNHFHINDLKIDLTLPKPSKNSIKRLGEIPKEIKIKEEHKKETLSSRIGLEYPEYKEVWIKIPKNTRIDTPIELTYRFEKKDSFVHKIKIICEESSSVHFIMKYQSEDQNAHFHYLKEEVTAEKNSMITITHINLLNEKSTNIMAFESKENENASIKRNLIDIGAAKRIYNDYSESKEYQSRYDFNNLYIGSKESIIDMNYELKNIGIKSINKMKVEGVLTDFSKKIFRGTIDFLEGCKNAIGEENENCILLSDTCKSKSLPMMLCHEENVVGSHGVSTGKVSKNKLFYLMSRGFSKKEAERLIVLGSFQKVLENIPSEKVQNELLQEIEKQI